MGSDDKIIYSKIELLVRDNNVNSQSVRVLSFTNCKMILTSDYIIIESKLIDNTKIGEIHNLNNIVSYKKTK